MLIVIVVVLVALGLAAGFAQAIRLSRRARQRSVPRPRADNRTIDSANADHLARLELSARVTYDRQNWVVVGRQRVLPRRSTVSEPFSSEDPATAPTGQPLTADWTAWHLESDGQPGWLAVFDADPTRVVFAVGAERPESVDPAAVPLRWRDVEWQRLDGAAGAPAAVAGTEPDGERQRLRQPRETLDARDLETVVFTRNELPRRRLVLERQAGDDRWAVWIGDLVSASMLDVHAPVVLPGAPSPDEG